VVIFRKGEGIRARAPSPRQCHRKRESICGRALSRPWRHGRGCGFCPLLESHG
jgi:hypothetical protein